MNYLVASWIFSGAVLVAVILIALDRHAYNKKQAMRIVALFKRRNG